MRDRVVERGGNELMTATLGSSALELGPAVVSTSLPVLGVGVTRFVALVLVLAACLGTARYALVTARHEPHDTLVWRYVALSTAVGGVFSALLLAETTRPAVGTVLVAFRLLSQLFFAVFLALSLRELYYAQPATSTEGTRISLSTARRIETGFMLLALIQFPLVVWLGPTVVAEVIVATAAGAFTVYGVSFGQAIRARRLTHGTVLDATVTYVIAVLICVGTVSVIQGATATSLPAPAIRGAVNVLLVMIGTFLISLIIRLKRSADAASASA